MLWFVRRWLTDLVRRPERYQPVEDVFGDGDVLVREEQYRRRLDRSSPERSQLPSGAYGVIIQHEDWEVITVRIH